MAYGAGGGQPEGGDATGAHGGVQRAPAPVVTPQHPFHGTGGTAERGDRVSAAWIAEEEVTEKAGGGAVREDAFGTHGSTGRGERETKSVAGEPGTAAAHGDGSSLRVSAPWLEEVRR
ncbi:hypothetical protein GCM10022384_11030 [Streptomyces marokkonensis]|uniref:Uncharacterized protein n=1 Tax=Streptomyces marokkonensis TaxID=324855 RepID=A0ABP7P6J7_9ACTN